MCMKIIDVIPARFNSSRFPGKPLMDICGKPMIWWVYHQVKKVRGMDEVYVATDDERIKEICSLHDINYVKTRNNHGTRTEGVHEVAKKVKADFYVVVNGDEQLISPLVIEKILPKQEIRSDFYVANLMTEIKRPVEAIDPSNIKVVTSEGGTALFMSRSPIPYPKKTLTYNYYKHVGILLYTFAALDFFANTPKGYNEKIEDINELRFIENNKPLKMICVESESLSVDTPRDLERVRIIMKERIRGKEYNE